MKKKIKKLSKKKKNKRQKKMGMVNAWSEMSLKKKKKKKEMKFVWKEERLSAKGWFWVKMGEKIEMKWGKNERCSYEGLERENGGREREGAIKNMNCEGNEGALWLKT